MDRNRLKEVHQTDLTESRVNEDFVDWLKTKGPSWLLLILIGVGGYLGIIRWRQYKTQHFVEAWVAYAGCRLPGAFEDVAERYADVPGLPQEARLTAADRLLEAVQTGTALSVADDDATTTPPPKLSGEEREQYLARAERLYREIADADDGSLAMTLHVVGALQGVAVVAESQGDLDKARTWYEKAAERAEPNYPQLAVWARQRSATVDQYAQAVTLPTSSDLPPGQPPELLEPAPVDDALKDLLQLDEPS